MIRQLIDFSKANSLSHIPSALSMLDYIDVLFSEKYIIPFRDKIVLGKPFGSQTYYLVWKQCGYLDNIENLSVGVKHCEIPFVDFSEETMGNALGVATGIAIACPNNTVYVNLSDASLQMGSTLEAIAYIGANRLDNIVVTIDYNQMQVTGKTDDIVSVKPCPIFFKNYGWNVTHVDGHDRKKLHKAFLKIKKNRTEPLVYFCHTIKGHGVDYMEIDPITWHYKTIN
jgi:transketolase